MLLKIGAFDELCGQST